MKPITEKKDTATADPTQVLQELVCGQIVDLLNVNASGIAEELSAAADSKLSVSVSIKLSRVGSKLYSEGGLSYARRFRDTVEGSVELPDPNQTKLPLK